MSNTRIGFGYDMHKLNNGSSILLAGVEITSKYTVEAHSDGDIVLHSLSDAIYGSIAEGDIGIHFPSDSKNLNIDSKNILNHAYNLLKKRNYKINNIDITIVIESPRLQPQIIRMRESLSKLLGISINQISIKSSTSQKIGLVGQHKAVICYSTILISNG
jgi:2-C-methyl-D-erythritol 2,4-cyclodiphosphate synthase